MVVLWRPQRKKRALARMTITTAAMTMPAMAPEEILLLLAGAEEEAAGAELVLEEVEEVGLTSPLGTPPSEGKGCPGASMY